MRDDVLRSAGTVLRSADALSLFLTLGWAAAALFSLPDLWAINRIAQQIAGMNGAALPPGLLGFTPGLSLQLGLLAGWPAYHAGRLSNTQALGHP